MSQLSFATLDYQAKKKRTKREKFLGEMDAVVPWAVLEALIAPYYPKAGNGRRPYPLAVMLRIYFLQQWYQLSDPAAEKALYDSNAMRQFARLELGRENHDPQFSPSTRAPRSDEGAVRGCECASGGTRMSLGRRYDHGCDIDRGLTIDQEQRTKTRPRYDPVEEG